MVLDTNEVIFFGRLQPFAVNFCSSGVANAAVAGRLIIGQRKR
jgi:hypothetical protein